MGPHKDHEDGRTLGNSEMEWLETQKDAEKVLAGARDLVEDVVMNIMNLAREAMLKAEGISPNGQHRQVPAVPASLR